MFSKVIRFHENKPPHTTGRSFLAPERYIIVPPNRYNLAPALTPHSYIRKAAFNTDMNNDHSY